jgi:GT2 family glycosyltransferase
VSARQQIVVLGMMTKMPVAGVVWQTLHYIVGLERLGYETYYVEAHARTPSMLMELPDDDSSAMAAAFIAGTLERFGFGDRWAFHALHDDGRYYGMSKQQLENLYRSAALIINLHGGTEPRAEHIATDRLVYLETDPVEVELQLAEGRQATVDYLRPHCAFFTFGENYGRSDCLLPVSPLFNFQATRQPVVLDFWSGRADAPGKRYTTIGNWRQQWRDVEFGGERYTWSKHHEFLKFLELPERVETEFELALGGCEDSDRRLLEHHGWHVREAQPISLNIDIYRQYIAGSRAEFTVAKDQNVRLRTGWFSDRSATYLAAGRPVITQDTGFGNVIPTGEGLFAFSTLDDIATAVELIEADYERHSHAAAMIAREYFDTERVLGRLLAEVGMPRISPGIVIAPSSRRPTTLPAGTVRAVLEARLPVSLCPLSEQPEASVIVITCDGLVFTRLCLESVLGNLGAPSIELIVVDNGSTDGTVDYLHGLADRDGRVRLITNGRNIGFAAAANQGFAASTGQRLVLLNNDTILPPGCLERLARHLNGPNVGAVGPVTNRIGNEAQVDAPYETYAGLLEFAVKRASDFAHRTFAIRTLAMFCLAMRRETWERIGPLDERFGIGLLEDDDYAERIRRAGLHLLCAEDVFVHHFGEASFGKLVPTGEYSTLLRNNQRLFEEKWGTPWEPYERRPSAEYLELRERVRAIVRGALPQGATVGVVSRGDDELLRLDGLQAWHFPQIEDGSYAGYYPADGAEAVLQVERLRARGANFLLFPRTAFWWLDHYNGLRWHLEHKYELVSGDDSCVVFALSGKEGGC